MAGLFPESFLDELRQAITVHDAVRRRLKLKKDGVEYRAIDNNSLCVNPRKNVWAEFGGGGEKITGGDIFAFEQWFSKCSFTEAVEDLAKYWGMPLPRTVAAVGASRSEPEEPPPPQAAPEGPMTRAREAKREITETYDYRDADWLLNYQVCRVQLRLPDGSWQLGKKGKPEKQFSQRRPYGPLVDADKQKWIWGLGAGTFLRGRDGNYYQATKDRLERWRGAASIEVEACVHGLYRFPELREEMAQPEDERRIVFITEGERKCDLLAGWGCVTTTNSGGAKNWRPEHAEELRDADVVVLLDNDVAGRTRGHAVAASLRYIAKSVKVLSWPDHWRECPEGGDVVDWAAAGGDPESFFKIVEGLREWTPEKPESKFGAVRFEDVDAVSAPLRWTIRGILQAGSVSLWYGAPSCGKSFLLIDAAMAIARGIPWMGANTRRGLVIYQTGEGGAGFRLRVKAYKKHMRMTADERVPFLYLPVRINLYQSDVDVNGLIEEIKAWASYYDEPLELIAIDTFNAASGGANENSNTDVGKVLERCRKIVEVTGAHVAVVHHTPATGGRPRGHSSLVGDVETTIAVEETELIDSTEDQDGSSIPRTIRNWVVTKQKDGPSRMVRSFVVKQVKLGVDFDGEAETSCVVHQLATAAEAAEVKALPDGWKVLHQANFGLFKCLDDVLKERARTPNRNVPAGVQAVTIDDWNDELIKRLTGHEVITDKVKKTMRQRVRRATESWVGMGLLAKEFEWIWRVPGRMVFRVDRLPTGPVRTARAEPLLAPGESPEDLIDFMDQYSGR